MGVSEAADSLRVALAAQFGASARQIIDRELDRVLTSRKTLGRKDLDNVEKNVAEAVQQQRAPRARTGRSHRAWSTEAPASASAAALAAARTPTSNLAKNLAGSGSRTLPSLRGKSAPWAGDMQGVQCKSGGRTTGLGRQSSAASSSRKSLSRGCPSEFSSSFQGRGQGAAAAAAAAGAATTNPQMFATGLSWASTASSSRARTRTDLFDLMAQHADEEHRQGEERAKSLKKLKMKEYCSELDAQVDQKRQRKVAAEAEKSHWHQVIQKQVEQFEQDLQAKSEKKANELERMKGIAAEAYQSLRQRKLDGENEFQRSCQDLREVLAHEEKVKQITETKQSEKQLSRIKDAQAEFEETSCRKAQRKAAEAEECQRLAAEARARAEKQEEQANLGYKKRQEVVDRLHATVGKAYFNATFHKDRAIQDREQAASSEHASRRWAQYWVEEKERHQRGKAYELANLKLAQEVLSTKGVEERKQDEKQLKVWAEEARKDTRHEEAARKATLRKQVSMEALQTIRSNASLHPADRGVSDTMREQDLSFHRSVLKRMASQQFRPDESMPLLEEADTLKRTLQPLRGTLRKRC